MVGKHQQISPQPSDNTPIIAHQRLVDELWMERRQSSQNRNLLKDRWAMWALKMFLKGEKYWNILKAILMLNVNLLVWRPAISPTEGASRTAWSGGNQDCNYRLETVFLWKAKPASMIHCCFTWKAEIIISLLPLPLYRSHPLFVLFLPKCQRGSALIIGGGRGTLSNSSPM